MPERFKGEFLTTGAIQMYLTFTFLQPNDYTNDVNKISDE